LIIQRLFFISISSLPNNFCPCKAKSVPRWVVESLQFANHLQLQLLRNINRKFTGFQQKISYVHAQVSAKAKGVAQPLPEWEGASTGRKPPQHSYLRI
jgi:hypothetical protein